MAPAPAVGGGVPAVLLVPGWSDTSRALRRARAFFLAGGWPAGHVCCLDFRDRFGSNVEHAAEIARAVESLRALSGAAEVGVVAHSMGGLALRWYLTGRPDPAVRTAIFAGTPHRGTWAAWLAWGAGGREMRPGSRFLRELSERPLTAEVRTVCLRTPIDTRVLPGSSAFLAGAECVTVRRPRHQRLLHHEATLRLIASLLQPRD